VRAVADLQAAAGASAAVLDPDDDRFMAEYSGVPRSSTALTGAMERLAARRIAQAAQTLDTEIVGRQLAVCRTRVQRLLEDGDLHAYREGRRNRYRSGSSSAANHPLPAWSPNSPPRRARSPPAAGWAGPAGYRRRARPRRPSRNSKPCCARTPSPRGTGSNSSDWPWGTRTSRSRGAGPADPAGPRCGPATRCTRSGDEHPGRPAAAVHDQPGPQRPGQQPPGRDPAAGASGRQGLDATARPPPPAGLPLSMEIARVDQRSCRRSQLTDGEGQCG